MQRSEYTTINVDPDLLIQVLQELFAMAKDPNDVEVTDAEHGRVILAHPELAEAWYQKAIAKENTPVPEPEPAPKKLATVPKEPEVVAESTTEPVEVVAIANTSEEEDAPEPPPVKRGPGRPPKSSYTSASNGEEP